MDKETTVSSYNHSINLLERKMLVITGVKKIENFDSNHFLLETTMGFLNVKGEELELIKLDTLAGNVTIKGNVSSMDYILDSKQKSNEDGIFSRLFK